MTEKMDQPQQRIEVPDMCKTHQALLVAQAGYGKADPWQALIIVAQIALFQAVTSDPKMYARVGGDAQKLATLGCFACVKPDAFGEIVQAAQSVHGLARHQSALGAIKALGESWVYIAAARVDK